MSFSSCTVCGLAIASGTICLVCDAETRDELVSVATTEDGLIVAWWTGESTLGLKANAVLSAQKFAELVRAQRSHL